MPRIRYLKPDFFFDEELAGLSFACRLLFQGLWCYADREGRLEDKPKKIKAQIFPYETVKIEEMLEKLNGRFIDRYEVKGRKYIQIKTFTKHQKVHHTEKESQIPEYNGYLTVKEPLKTGGNGEGNGNGNGNGKGTKKFVPPNLSEIKKYVQEKKLNVNPQRFYDYFTTGNWIDSKGNKVRSWKQKLITWAEMGTSGRKYVEPERTTPYIPKKAPKQLNTPEAKAIQEKILALGKIFTTSSTPEARDNARKEVKKLQNELNGLHEAAK